jgi:hypothetical protein
MTILSKLVSTAQILPKPPLSILRVLGVAAMDNPIGLAVGATTLAGVGAVEIFKNKAAIESTLAKAVSVIKTPVSSSTTAMASSVVESKSTTATTVATTDDSMIIPLILGGCVLLVIFAVVRK